MNSEYFKNFINLKDQGKEAYQSYSQRITTLFAQLKLNHNNNTCIRFESELHAVKDYRELKTKDRQEIYKYFVQRNVKNFNFMRDNSAIELRILKLTKVSLQNYQLDWLQLWKQLLNQQPEMSTVKLYSELIDFLKNVRHLYSPDNAVQVIDYFMEKHSLYTDNIYLFISLFANISQKTSKTTLLTFVQKLLEMYELNQIKASNMLVMFINAVKFKNNEVPPAIYQELSNIILYSLATPSAEKKDSIEPKFNTQTANIILKVIGKSNSSSVDLLKHIFQLAKNFIRPFQDSKKPLKFLYQLIGGLAKRFQSQETYRKKIIKLKEKQQKKKRIQANKNKQKLISQSEEQAEESSVTANQQQTQSEHFNENKQQSNGQQQNKKTDSKQQQNQKIDSKAQKINKDGEQQDSEDEQEEENDSQDEQQQGKIQKMVSMELDIQEQNSDKTNSIQTKIQRLEALLENQLTSQIKECFRIFIEERFQDIFYVNSKKIVNKLLKQLFKVYPQFITKSFEVLEKAGSIPHINEEGLISNIKHIAKYLFVEEMTNSENFLQNILKLLNRIQANRRITDVWEIINIFTQKIPLLDEQDMAKIPEEQKQYFQTKYGQRHDTFYQTYSELIFQSLKRLFEQSEHYDVSTSANIDKSLIDLLCNSHPYFKKRVMKEMEEQIIENNNKFLLSVFNSNLKISRQFQRQLKDLIQNRNIENEQNLQLDINVNIILSVDMNIDYIKQLIRKYSKKNNYKFLKQIMISLTNYNINFEPLSSSLKYLSQKPTFKLSQDPSIEFVIDKLKHVFDFGQQIIDELLDQLKQFSSKPLQSQAYESIITRMYLNNESTFKNMKVEKRKLVNELLEILKNIYENLFHQIQQYNPQKNTIDYKAAPYNRQSLLVNPKFKQILQILTYNQIFLHDHNIMHNLSSILQNQVFFMYRHQMKLQKQILKKYAKRKVKEELPGQSNLNNMVSVFITKARLIHLSLLLNKYKDTVSITPIERLLRILLVAPGNQKCNLINRILVKKTVDINLQAQNLIILLANNIDSRFYSQKVLSLLAEFNTAGFQYTTEQIISLIDLHIPLIQSQNIKIRQGALKSFEKFMRTLSKINLFGKGERQLRKYLQREKLQIVWVIAVIIVLKQPRRDTQVEQYLRNIQQYLRELAKLILSETRIIRRIALFAYSFCIRKAKKACKFQQQIKNDTFEYSKAKTIEELFQDGYIRQEQKENVQLVNRSMVKKMAPYSSFSIKKSRNTDIYEQLQKQSYQFMLANEVGLNVLKQFHTDMAGSVEQVLSMMHNKKNDLGQISLKLLQGCYVYTKLKKLHFDRIQYYFGERFFRYLLHKDAKFNQWRYFLSTREYIQSLLPNFQAYDNQTLIFIYTMDVLFAYEKNYKQIQASCKVQIQKFVLKIFSQIIYKGSAVLFKKLMIILGKNQNKQAMLFITQYLEGLTKRKEKVPRATQLLFAIYQQNYQQFSNITKFALTQKLDINSNYLHLLINTIISLPQKYLITQKNNKKYKFLAVEAELTAGHLQTFKKHIYLLSTQQFNTFLVQTLSNYVETAQQLPITQAGQQSQQIKLRNEIIKATYSIATNSISAYIQFYQTQQTVSSIVQLLEILFRIFELKMDLFVDFKQLQQTLKSLFSNKYEEIQHFQRILSTITLNLHKIPIKKQVDMIKIITNRPANFLFADRAFYHNFILSIVKLQDNTMIYRQLLLSISTFLAYVPLSEAEIQELLSQLNKNQGIVLLQSHALSTLQIGSVHVDKILKESSKERRNIFCKQILVIRGKKEYLDSEESCKQWKEIKQYSNPYHYHA